MDNIIFKNKENTPYKVGDKEIWEHRSSSVDGIVFAIYNEELYVLVEKRSSTMRDQPSKWCMPCGYIDWDETGYEAVIREIYQETGLYLPHYNNFLVFNNKEENEDEPQPFYVKSDPFKTTRQNIAHFYIFIYKFLNSLPSVSTYSDNEIDEIKWMKVSEAFNNKYEWAFEHNVVIKQSITKFQKYLK